jgi:aminopeptidase N
VLAVSAFRTRGAGLERTHSALVDVSTTATPVDLPGDADFYLVNDRDLTFATIRPDVVGKQRFLAAAPGLPDVISRGVAVAAVRDMLTAGEATAAELVGLIVRVLAVETSEALVQPYLRLAHETAELWASDRERPALLAEVAGAARAMLDQPDRRRVGLRMLAASAASEAELDTVRAEAGDDVDLRWRILMRASELGADTDDEAQRLLAVDPDPDAKFRAVAVRAAAPDADRKADAWRAMADDREVPIGLVYTVSQAFWRPGQDALLAPYADRFVALLGEFDKRGMISAMHYTNRLFPQYAIDETFLTRAEHASEGTAPVVGRTLLGRADQMRRVLRSRAAA